MKSQKLKLRYISTDSVKNPDEAFYDVEKLNALSDSIERFGVAVPITVTRRALGYTLVSGGRRLAAARRAGVRTVPALIVKDPESAPLYAVLCDVHREQPNEFRTARALKALAEALGVDAAQLSEDLGLDEELVRSYKKLLTLSPERQCLCEVAMCGKEYSDRIAALPESEKARLFFGLTNESLPLEERASTLRERLGCKGTAIPRRTVAIKDVRIFLNTIDRAVDVMQSSGVNAATERHDFEDFTEYLIRIPLESARRPAKPLTATST